jgi:hypothetical protein
MNQRKSSGQNAMKGKGPKKEVEYIQDEDDLDTDSNEELMDDDSEEMDERKDLREVTSWGNKRQAFYDVEEGRDV